MKRRKNIAAVVANSYRSKMDNVPALPPGQLIDLEQFARERIFDDRVLLAALLPLAPAAHAEAVRRGDPDLIYGLLRQASNIVRDIKYALAPFGLEDAYYGRLWQHSDAFPNPLKEESWAPDQAAVEQAVSRYLEHPWMSVGYLDWSLADALIRREIHDYQCHVASAFPQRWTSAWAMQKTFSVWVPWLIEIVIAAAAVGWLWFEFSSDAPHRWWWAAGAGAFNAWWLVANLIGLPTHIRHRRAKRKELLAIAERLKAMHRCYAELSGPVLDPTRIRDALLAAEKLEVRWSRATWPLLDAAITRHPHRWATGY